MEEAKEEEAKDSEEKILLRRRSSRSAHYWGGCSLLFLTGYHHVPVALWTQATLPIPHQTTQDAAENRCQIWLFYFSFLLGGVLGSAFDSGAAPTMPARPPPPRCFCPHSRAAILMTSPTLSTPPSSPADRHALPLIVLLPSCGAYTPQATGVV